MTATYYAQRASAGLIVTEGVFPTADGKGGAGTPGMVTDDQEAGWKTVVDAVQRAGGRIVMQLMHTGRISHPDLQPDNQLPVAPSALRPPGFAWTEDGQKDFVTPRELSVHEIGDIVDGHRRATRRAMNAGFDGVELHGCGGYLPEQFLASGSNHLTDAYGGSIAGRARFMLETLDAMIEEAGAGRVGLKISPSSHSLIPNEIHDGAPWETYTHLTDQLPADKMAYLTVSYFDDRKTEFHDMIRDRFHGSVTMGGQLTRESAEGLLNNGETAAAFFGRSFIANPDLVERFRRNAPLNESDTSRYYRGPGPQGYIDYPTLD